MCGPAAAVVFGASALVGAYSSYKQQDAANQANEYNAQMAERNAELSKQQAFEALQLGNQDIAKIKKNAATVRGMQRASLGASGAKVDAGSAAQVQQDTLVMSDQDAMTARLNAKKQYDASMIQAQDYRFQARAARAGNSSAALAGGASLLGSASTFAQSSYAQNMFAPKPKG
jgi:hypothetical protein